MKAWCVKTVIAIMETDAGTGLAVFSGAIGAGAGLFLAAKLILILL